MRRASQHPCLRTLSRGTDPLAQALQIWVQESEAWGGEEVTWALAPVTSGDERALGQFRSEQGPESALRAGSLLIL